MNVPLLLALTTTAILAAAPSAAQEYRVFKVPGTMQTATAQRSAFLNFGCSPDGDGGALSIELVLTEANTRKDFDYDDFEGPEPAAGSKALSHLRWTSASGKTELKQTASGWYAPEPPESFMFGINQLSGKNLPPAKFLGTVGTEPGQLVWTQTGFDDAKHQLVATFDFDADMAKRARAYFSPCLPIESKPAKSK